MNGLIRAFATGPDAPLLSDAAAIDAQYRRLRLRVMLAVTLGYGVAYTCRLALGVVKKPLIDAGIFSPEELGLIGAALFYGYAFGKLTNGFLADHANIKVFFATGVLVSALLNLGMGCSTVVWLSLLLWGLNGWFQGFGAPAGVVTLANWFSNRERGRFYGIWSTAHSLGEGLTFIGVAAVVTWFGWRAGFWVPGLLCIFTAWAIYRLVEDRPQTLGLPPVRVWAGDASGQAAAGPALASLWRVQLSILRMPAIWVLAAASAAMYVSRYAINSWGVLYLQEARGYSLLEAGSMLMASTIAGIAGCVAFGFVSDKLFAARRPPVNLIFALLETVPLFVIFYGPNDPVVLTAAFIVFGFGLSGILASLGGLFAVDIAPKRVAGAVMGFIGVFSYVGAAVQESISGNLIEAGITMVDGQRVYDFSAAIEFWIGASIVSMLLAAALWRTRLAD